MGRAHAMTARNGSRYEARSCRSLAPSLTKQESKNFFFAKKKQKTFIHEGIGKNESFLVLFFKKEHLSVYHLQLQCGGAR
jgi:hypothetical protein